MKESPAVPGFLIDLRFDATTQAPAPSNALTRLTNAAGFSS